MTDHEDVDEPGSSGDTEEGRWRVPGPFDLGLPALLMIAVGLLLIGVAAVAAFQLRDLQGDEDDRQEAAEVASEFTTALLAYDHQDLQGSIDRVIELSTPEYAGTYQEAFSAELQPVIDQLEARGEVLVRDVFVGDISGDRVGAVVLFDATIDSTVGTRRLTGSYVQIDLVKVDGEWRGNDLVFLATTEEGLDPAGGDAADGTSPTTTAAPSPTTTAPG